MAGSAPCQGCGSGSSEPLYPPFSITYPSGTGRGFYTEDEIRSDFSLYGGEVSVYDTGTRQYVPIDIEDVELGHLADLLDPVPA